MIVWILYGTISVTGIFSSVLRVPRPAVFRSYKECYRQLDLNKERLLKEQNVTDVHLQCDPFEVKK